MLLFVFSFSLRKKREDESEAWQLAGSNSPHQRVSFFFLFEKENNKRSVFEKGCVEKSISLLLTKINYNDRPRIRRHHPPDLSISLSGGKETNQDSPSSGERSGKSPSPKSGCRKAPRIVASWVSIVGTLPKQASRNPLERGAAEGESPVREVEVGVPAASCRTLLAPRVGLLGNAAPSGW